MKKTIALILGIILVLSLTACGKSAEKEKTVYQRGDTVTLKNWEITITDFQFFDFSDKEEHPEEKGIEVNCTVKNIGKKEETFFSSGFWLKKDTIFCGLCPFGKHAKDFSGAKTRENKNRKTAYRMKS